MATISCTYFVIRIVAEHRLKALLSSEFRFLMTFGLSLHVFLTPETPE